MPDDIVEAVGPVRPGDTLILRLAAGISRPQFEEAVDMVTSTLKERMPDVGLCFVAGVDQIVVYRPDPEAALEATVEALTRSGVTPDEAVEHVRNNPI